MGKGKKGRKNGGAKAERAVARLPKKKCCESRSQCERCPLRMLKEGTLPSGYTVHKRRLMTLAAAEEIRLAKQAKKAKKAVEAA